MPKRYAWRWARSQVQCERQKSDEDVVEELPVAYLSENSIQCFFAF